MDDFIDDFDDGDFMDNDSLEDSFEENCEAEGSFDNDPEMGDEPDEAEPHDNFTARDAFILGVAMFAYEEGLEEAERRRLEKEMGDDEDVHNRDSKT